MSRFIKYASNLLDGVDSMAKDSLTDQGDCLRVFVMNEELEEVQDTLLVLQQQASRRSPAAAVV